MTWTAAAAVLSIWACRAQQSWLCEWARIRTGPGECLLARMPLAGLVCLAWLAGSVPSDSPWTGNGLGPCSVSLMSLSTSNHNGRKHRDSTRTAAPASADSTGAVVVASNAKSAAVIWWQTSCELQHTHRKSASCGTLSVAPGSCRWTDGGAKGGGRYSGGWRGTARHEETGGYFNLGAPPRGSPSSLFSCNHVCNKHSFLVPNTSSIPSDKSSPFCLTAPLPRRQQPTLHNQHSSCRSRHLDLDHPKSPRRFPISLTRTSTLRSDTPGND